MNKPDGAHKKFSKSYVLLHEQAQLMLEYFIEDLAVFNARYPHMTAAYAQEWRDAITAADIMPDDDAVVGDQKVKTFAVSEAITLAENKVETLTSFLKLIYKTDPKRVLEHFGLKQARRTRNRQVRQKELLELAYERASSDQYKPGLIAKGFSQLDIDELNSLAQQLDTANTEQDKMKTERPEMARERILLFNRVWDYMTEAHIAADILFANDYGRQQRYLLYPERRHSAKRGASPKPV